MATDIIYVEGYYQKCNGRVSPIVYRIERSWILIFRQYNRGLEAVSLTELVAFVSEWLLVCGGKSSIYNLISILNNVLDNGYNCTFANSHCGWTTEGGNWNDEFQQGSFTFNLNTCNYRPWKCTAYIYKLYTRPFIIWLLVNFLSLFSSATTGLTC